MPGPLSHRPFRRFLAGRVAGVMGRQIVAVTVGWDIYHRTNSALALGAVGLVQVLPVVLLALPVGAIVDQRDRRRIGGASLVAATFVALALAAIAWRSAPVPWLYLALLVQGCANAFNSPATAALVPRLVPIEERARANAWASTSFGLASVVGPGLAGTVIALADSAAPAYLLAALGQAGFAFALQTLPRDVGLPEGAPAERPDWRGGARFVFRSPLVLPAITLDMFAVLFGGVTALLPIFAKDVLGAGASGLGWLRAAPALGALTMAFAGTRLPPWRRPGRALLIAVAGFGIVTLGFAASRVFALSWGLLYLAGALDNVSVVVRATLVQMVTPDALRGRVSSIQFVFVGLSNELGEFESGLTAALLGPVGSVLLGGVATVCVVASIAALCPKLRRLGPLAALLPEGETAAAGD